ICSKASRAAAPIGAPASAPRTSSEVAVFAYLYCSRTRTFRLTQGTRRMLCAMAIRSPKWLVLATLVAIAPDTPGVFELWDDDEVVFVGATRSERSTLRSEL